MEVRMAQFLFMLLSIAVVSRGSQTYSDNAPTNETVSTVGWNETTDTVLNTSKAIPDGGGVGSKSNVSVVVLNPDEVVVDSNSNGSLEGSNTIDDIVGPHSDGLVGINSNASVDGSNSDAVVRSTIKDDPGNVTVPNDVPTVHTTAETQSATQPIPVNAITSETRLTGVTQSIESVTSQPQNTGGLGPSVINSPNETVSEIIGNITHDRNATMLQSATTGMEGTTRETTHGILGVLETSTIANRHGTGQTDTTVTEANDMTNDMTNVHDISTDYLQKDFTTSSPALQQTSDALTDKGTYTKLESTKINEESIYHTSQDKQPTWRPAKDHHHHGLHSIHGLVWEDHDYLLRVLFPVGCGILGAVVIVCVMYACAGSSTSCSAPCHQHQQEKDRMLLLDMSSEDDMEEITCSRQM